MYKCLILTIVFTFSGCGPANYSKKINITNSYFKNGKKVGIIYNIHPITVCEDDWTMEYGECYSPYGEYEVPLNVVDNKIRSIMELQIKDNYKNLFKEKGKSFIEIDHNLYLLDSLPEFNEASSSKKSYYQFDLRPLKSQYFKDYEIDELFFVEVEYGLDYYNPFFLVETRRGYCWIKSEIVDLNDNSFIFRSWSEWGGTYLSLTNSYGRIKGRWKTPPEYENLSNAIKSAISKSLSKEREKLINL